MKKSVEIRIKVETYVECLKILNTHTLYAPRESRIYFDQVFMEILNRVEAMASDFSNQVSLEADQKLGFPR